ncbi:hypothetical protein NQ315_007829, partial [Exocentrus adspersus]
MLCFGCVPCSSNRETCENCGGPEIYSSVPGSTGHEGIWYRQASLSSYKTFNCDV